MRTTRPLFNCSSCPQLPLMESLRVTVKEKETVQLHGDNFAIAIPVDRKEHTEESPFCNHTLNPDCLCREDQDNIAPIAQAVNDGLMTPKEATDYVMGRTIQGGWK